MVSILPDPKKLARRLSPNTTDSLEQTRHLKNGWLEVDLFLFGVSAQNFRGFLLLVFRECHLTWLSIKILKDPDMS